MIFRRLEDNEEDAGYDVICQAVAWIRDRDIDLWRVPLSREAYARRQRNGENFGLFVGSDLAVIMSRRREAPADWAESVLDTNMRWLSTLATATAFRGRSLGRAAVLEAAALLGAHGVSAIYLDSSPGFLPAFYAVLGFETIERRTRLIQRLPDGPPEPVPVVLMKKRLDAL